MFSWRFLGAFLNLFKSTKRLSKLWPDIEINIQITTEQNPGVESYVGGEAVITDQVSARRILTVCNWI